MLQTHEAFVDEDGNIHFLNPIRLPAPRRALVVILDEEPSGYSETALLSEAALAEDWNRPEEDEAWSFLQEAES